MAKKRSARASDVAAAARAANKGRVKPRPKPKPADDIPAEIRETVSHLTDLRSRYKAATRECRKLKKDCEARVVEWRWAASKMSHLELLRNERGGHARGRCLKSKPKDSDGRAWYSDNQRGHDDYIYDGDVLVAIDSTWSNTPHTPSMVLSATFDVEFGQDGQLNSLTVNYRKTAGHSGESYSCFKRRSR